MLGVESVYVPSSSKAPYFPSFFDMLFQTPLTSLPVPLRSSPATAPLPQPAPRPSTPPPPSI